MPNFKTATKDDAQKTGMLYVRDSAQVVKKIAAVADFQVGLSNLQKKLVVTGEATFQSALNVIGDLTATTIYISELLVSNGDQFLVAGTGIDLSTAANGQITISTTGGGGGTPGGSDTYVQFNDGGSTFGGDAGLTYNKTTDTLTVAGDVAVNGGDLTTTQTTFNLINTTATTLNVGGAATAINLGSSTVSAIVGKSELGSWPANPTYAYYGHETLDHSNVGNYALLQYSNGDTYLNSPDAQYIRIRNDNNTLAYFSSDSGTTTSTISITGITGYDTVATFGSTAGASSATINAGTGDINIGTSNSARSTNIATGAAAQVLTLGSTTGASSTTIRAGTAGITMTGNAALSGDLAVNGGDITTTSTGTATVFNANATTVNIAGGATTGTTVGNATGGVTLNGNATVTGDLAVNGATSADITTTTATATLFNTIASTITAGGAATTINLGVNASGSPTTLNLGATSASSVVNVNRDLSVKGNTTLGDAVTDTTTVAGDLAVNGGDLTTTQTTFNLVNATATTLNIGGAATTINMGAATVSAIIGDTETGTWSTNSDYAVFKHKDLTDSTQYALLQQNNGNTYINSATTSTSIILENAGDTIGTLDDNTISLTGKSATATTATIGQTTGASQTNINAGTSGINLNAGGAASSAAFTTFQFNGSDLASVGYNSTFNFSACSFTGLSSSPLFATLGSMYGLSSTTIDIGTGELKLASGSFAGSRKISIGIGGDGTGNSGIQSIFIGKYNITGGINSYLRGDNVTIGDDGGAVTIGRSAASVTFSGGIAVNGGDITTTSTGTATVFNTNAVTVNIGGGATSGMTVGNATGGVTIPGDLAVNGGDLTTTSSTFNLLNNASTLNIGTTGIARTISIGTGTTGTQTIDIGTFSSNVADIRIGNYSGNVTPSNCDIYGDTINIGAASASAGGTINIGTSSNTQTINIGPSAASKTITIGSTISSSPVTIQSGTGTVTITSTTTTEPDATIGTMQIGTWPANTDYAVVGHSSLDHTDATNYALLQRSNGETFLNCATSQELYLRYANTTRMQINSTGMGFFGVTPVARQTGGAATADLTYSSNERDMINAMYTALRNYGLLT
jgi:hypothetical protein